VVDRRELGRSPWCNLRGAARARPDAAGWPRRGAGAAAAPLAASQGRRGLCGPGVRRAGHRQIARPLRQCAEGIPAADRSVGAAVKRAARDWAANARASDWLNHGGGRLVAGKPCGVPTAEARGGPAAIPSLTAPHPAYVAALCWVRLQVQTLGLPFKGCPESKNVCNQHRQGLKNSFCVAAQQ
jgi:hypothetical protein